MSTCAASAVPQPPRAFDRAARDRPAATGSPACSTSRFGVPGTRFSFGWDSIIGLIPGVGDTLALAPSAYLVWKAHQLGVPRSTLARMAANSGIDFAVGTIPILGDVFDALYKANRRNVDAAAPASMPSRPRQRLAPAAANQAAIRGSSASHSAGAPRRTLAPTAPSSCSAVTSYSGQVPPPDSRFAITGCARSTASGEHRVVARSPASNSSQSA